MFLIMKAEAERNKTETTIGHKKGESLPNDVGPSGQEVVGH
jgi:hypothetical protein